MAAGNEPQLGLVALATAILKDATAVEEYLKERGLPQPSFLPGAPPRLNIEDRAVAEAHERVLNATRELHHLTLGPMQSLTSLVSVRNQCRASVRFQWKAVIADLVSPVRRPFCNLGTQQA